MSGIFSLGLFGAMMPWRQPYGDEYYDETCPIRRAWCILVGVLHACYYRVHATVEPTLTRLSGGSS